MATMTPEQTMATMTTMSAVTTDNACTTMATMAGLSCIFAAQQGKPYDREKHRDSNYDHTIHPKSSKIKKGTVTFA